MCVCVCEDAREWVNVRERKRGREEERNSGREQKREMEKEHLCEEAGSHARMRTPTSQASTHAQTQTRRKQEAPQAESWLACRFSLPSRRSLIGCLPSRQARQRPRAADLHSLLTAAVIFSTVTCTSSHMQQQLYTAAVI